MRRFFSLTFALCLPSHAQCPTTPSPHFDCVSAGGNTQITLFADAELSWDRFNISSGTSLEITSSGGLFSSRHLITTPGNSSIQGPVTADGPFSLLTQGKGLIISDQGSITAPSILISSLPSLSSDTFQGNTRIRQLINSGSLNATSGDLTLLTYQLTNNGSVSAPSGKITLISTGSETISRPNFQRTPTSTPARPLARATNRGNIQAPIVEIYSEGFIQNGGRLTGNQMTLEASGIAHNNTPGSLITTPNLTLIPNVLLDGPIIDPNDGSNPGGVSTTLGLPNLATGSFSSKAKTKLLPTQFSSSTLNRSRIPSAVSKRNKPSKITPNSRLATRGSTPKKSTAKKRSFFGTITTK